MALNDELNKAVKDTVDATKEAGHRSAAEAEKTRREVAGDVMTPGEKAGSVANEATNRAQAEIDKAKRTVRDNT